MQGGKLTSATHLGLFKLLFGCFVCFFQPVFQLQLSKINGWKGNEFLKKKTFYLNLHIISHLIYWCNYSRTHRQWIFVWIVTCWPRMQHFHGYRCTGQVDIFHYRYRWKCVKCLQNPALNNQTMWNKKLFRKDFFLLVFRSSLLIIIN